MIKCMKSNGIFQILRYSQPFFSLCIKSTLRMNLFRIGVIIVLSSHAIFAPLVVIKPALGFGTSVTITWSAVEFLRLIMSTKLYAVID